MISDQLWEQIRQLSLVDQLALIEALSHHVRGALTNTSVERARGLLATDQAAPSDDELHSAYVDFLNEKYR